MNVQVRLNGIETPGFFVPRRRGRRTPNPNLSTWNRPAPDWESLLRQFHWKQKDSIVVFKHGILQVMNGRASG